MSRPASVRTRARAPRHAPADRLTVAILPSPAPAAARGLARWLIRVAPRTARGGVAIALVSDRRMRTLNRTFRGHDEVTDVLSFPAEDGGTGRAGTPPPGAGKPLGDLAIGLGRAARQARAEGHALAVELRILALHGLLHLLGYDHERDRGTMRRVEERLRRRGGVPAGLIHRSTHRPVR